MGFKMKKTYLILVTLSVSALVNSAYASWVTVTTFTGDDDQSTNNFYIPTGYWRVVWSCTPKYSNVDSYFEVIVRNTNSAVVDSNLYHSARH